MTLPIATAQIPFRQSVVWGLFRRCTSARARALSKVKSKTKDLQELSWKITQQAYQQSSAEGGESTEEPKKEEPKKEEYPHVGRTASGAQASTLSARIAFGYACTNAAAEALRPFSLS